MTTLNNKMWQIILSMTVISYYILVAVAPYSDSNSQDATEDQEEQLEYIEPLQLGAQGSVCRRRNQNCA